MAVSQSTRTACLSRAHRLAKPIPPGGVWLIGAEQDCFGGCLDPTQTFHGAMDDVRLWRVERSQSQIVRSMFDSSAIRSGVDARGLVAFWDFDGDTLSNIVRDVGIEHNDLPLLHPHSFVDLVAEASQVSSEPPQLMPVHGGANVSGGVHSSLAFDNTAAVAASVAGFPSASFTVEAFVRMPLVPLGAETYQPQCAIFSYAAEEVTSLESDAVFLDNAILVQVLNSGGYIDTTAGFPEVKRLRGNLDVWVNGRSAAGEVPETAEGVARGRAVFNTQQLADGQWHHVAVTWRHDTGIVKAFVDGREATTVAESRQIVAPGTQRSGQGSFVLGQDQDCPAGCFSTSQALRGNLAEVRLWSEVRTQDQIVDGMSWPWLKPAGDAPPTLVARWTFDEARRSAGCFDDQQSPCIVQPSGGSATGTQLTLTAAVPRRTLSDAPHQPLFLSRPDEFKPDKALATSFAAGNAIYLRGQQALVSAGMAHFPTDAFTVEFWMRTSDKCRTGTPFSYAAGTGQYRVSDNMLTITNANNWQIAIAEDQGGSHMAHGGLDDHSGLASTHGDWTHVAVTWESGTGITRMYLDGRIVWTTVRARGIRLTGGGVLVIGREQDALGGGFGRGPPGDVRGGQGAGAQDFRGSLDEMRIWRVARAEHQIADAMELVSSPALAKNPDLVAYWTFDEGRGHVARDLSGHGNELVLSPADDSAWVVSTVTEKREERARGRDGAASGQPAPMPSPKKQKRSKRAHRGKRVHAMLTFFTVLLLLAAAAAAFIWRHELVDTCEPLVELGTQLLRSLRARFGRRHSAAYASMDDADFDTSDMTAAEAFESYRPPIR